MTRALALAAVVALSVGCGGVPRGDVGVGQVAPSEGGRWIVENRSDETFCYVQLDGSPASFTHDRLEPGEVLAPGASRSWAFAPLAPGADPRGAVRLFDCNKQILFQRALPLTAPAVITFAP